MENHQQEAAKIEISESQDLHFKYHHQAEKEEISIESIDREQIKAKYFTKNHSNNPIDFSSENPKKSIKQYPDLMDDDKKTKSLQFEFSDDPKTDQKPSENSQTFFAQMAKLVKKDPKISKTKLFLANLSSSLSVCLISFPLALSIVLSLDDRLPPSSPDKIAPSVGVLTLILGFITSFFVSGSYSIFRTFTGSQYALLSSVLYILGTKAIPCLAFSGFFLNLIFSLKPKLLKMINFIPSHVFEGLRIGTFFYLIVPDAYHLLRIDPKKSVKGVNLYLMIRSVIDNWGALEWTEVITAFLISFIALKLHRWRPLIPWFFIIGMIGACYGLAQSRLNLGLPNLPTLKDNYHMKPDFLKSMINELSGKKLIEKFSSISYLLNPLCFLSAIGMQLITLIEAGLTLRIYRAAYSVRPIARMEFLGITVSDAVAGIFGALPCTLPMGRNTVGFSTGANHRIVNLMNFVLMSVFFFACFGFLEYIPTAFMKALNFTNGYLLWNWAKYTDFWKYNKFYQVVCVFISVSMLFYDLTISLVVGWAITSLYYYFGLRGGSIIFINQQEDEEMREESEDGETKDTGSVISGNGAQSSQEGTEGADEGKGDVVVKKKGRKERKHPNEVFKVEIILNGPYCFERLQRKIWMVPEHAKVVEINFSNIFEKEIVYLGNYYEVFKVLEEKGLNVVITGVPEERIKASAQLQGPDKWVMDYLKLDSEKFNLDNSVAGISTLD